jgi:Ribonucleotide reductase inhibitor
MPRNTHRHTNKKSFQPPHNHITNYFAATIAHDSTDDVPSLPAHQLLSQTPAKVSAPQQLTPALQASLLNVGMRIRKAVPEGYKTHKTLAVETAMAASISRAEIRLPTADGFVTEQQAAAAAIPAPPRELRPFCEAYGVGGLAVQQESWLREMSGYGYAVYQGSGFSSQESGVSAIEVEDVATEVRGGVGRITKRRLDEYDDDDDDDDDDDEGYDEGTEQGERWQPPAPFTSRRAIAKPIGASAVNGGTSGSRRRRNGGAVQRVPRQFLVDDGSDFAEASFLRPCEESEVQMGGI